MLFGSRSPRKLNIASVGAMLLNGFAGVSPTPAAIWLVRNKN